MGKGFQNTAQQATEMGQAERQAGFYRTLMLWGRDGLHKFILNLIWLGLEREAERRGGRGSQAHHLLCSTCPIASGGCVSPASVQGTGVGAEARGGLSSTEQAGWTLVC